MVELIDGFTPYAGEDAEKYNRLRWWPGLTFGDILDRAADMFPHKTAFVDATSRLTYSQARDRVDRLAVSLMDLGILRKANIQLDRRVLANLAIEDTTAFSQLVETAKAALEDSSREVQTA